MRGLIPQGPLSPLQYHSLYFVKEKYIRYRVRLDKFYALRSLPQGSSLIDFWSFALYTEINSSELEAGVCLFRK
jgi:hypothetical protein